jgi:hypothetical protein
LTYGTIGTPLRYVNRCNMALGDSLSQLASEVQMPNPKKRVGRGNQEVRWVKR